MHFFAQNYNYAIFLSAWSYIFLAVALLTAKKTDLWKSFYPYLIFYAICIALVKFIYTFSYGTLNYKNELLFITNCLNYFGLISFLLCAVVAYNDFRNRQLKKYIVFPYTTIPILIYLTLGKTYFIISIFLSLFTPAIIVLLGSLYSFYKTVQNYKNRILFILILIICYALCVCFFEYVRFFNINSINLLAISELLSTIVIISLANVLFKYFKVYKENFIKIYDYIPFIWKHIPIATTISSILFGGFLFSNYLETNSKNSLITKTNNAISGIAETTAITLENLNEISLSLSRSPFLKEALAFPSLDKRKSINKMFDGYKNSFEVDLIYALTNNNKVFAFSG
ncbi:MAG: hypothetical protein LBF23_03095, partial [Endomicrobium sp.]|nr:hypothetical protein [Endomicrobium sp.]